MDGSPRRDVLLPNSVETIIQVICAEKNQPPLDERARKMLAAIGEEASTVVLTKILSGGPIRKTFSGFVVYLVNQSYPIQAGTVPNPCNSPQTMWSPSSSSPYNSPHRMNGENISRHLSFEDEPQAKRSSRRQSSPPHELRETNGSKTISHQLEILSKLEFRKLFLVLSYVGRQKLEDVVTPDGAQEIFNLKDLPMQVFEIKIWNTYGQKYCDGSDRSQYVNWDSGKTHLYYCHVSPDGRYNFKGPYLNSTKTHLQRSLGDDNIMIVKFLEYGEYDKTNIAEEGILVGLRRYRFLVFKDERKKVKKNQIEEEKKAKYSAVKCYFVHIGPISRYDCDQDYILSRKTLCEARRMFMHIHTLSTMEKYMARFSLILSKTMKLDLQFASVIVERIEDIPLQDERGNIIHDGDGKPILHTDGTGFISEDLAMKCPKDFSVAKYNTDTSFEKCNQFVVEEVARQQRGVEARKEPPLLMQCRLFHDGLAVKGTLLVNRKLEPGTIQIRPSMIKVGKDHTLPTEENFDSLEIVTISRRPGRSSFSKCLIALLSFGGVPHEFFLNLLTNTLKETRNVYSNRRAAMRVASNHDGLDYGFLAQRMISSGLPLNEPYLQYCLLKLENGEKTRLKEGKIPVSESYYLMGTADPTPTHVLNNDEVCVILENGQISGKVLVYRYPGMHFGDVHIMKAVYRKELEEFIGNAKYGIFFSTKGSTSAAYEMASGDFDGDRYWVSRNPELLKYFKASDPWKPVYTVPGSKKINPKDFSESELERELFKLFLESRKPSFNMGIAPDSWLSYMDRLLTLDDKNPNHADEKLHLKTKMNKLTDIYYEAVDAPKSGKKVNVPNDLIPEQYPHHMEKAYSYDSYSILGQIYNTVQAFKNEAAPKIEILKLPSFDVPIPEIYVNMWKARYEDYRKAMTEALNSGDESKNDAADEVIKKFKQMLYDAPDMEESTKSTEAIYKEAIAIYHITYDYAMSYMSYKDEDEPVKKCGFAWKVAGTALCNMYAWELADGKNRPFAILPSVLRELLN